LPRIDIATIDWVLVPGVAFDAQAGAWVMAAAITTGCSHC
jgi:hypothetical protein